MFGALFTLALANLCTLQASALTVTQPQLGFQLKKIQITDTFGPLMDSTNFPDPSTIKINDTWFAFATRTIGSSIHIQIAQSQDFTSWSIVQNEDGSQRDALPHLPSWVHTSSPNTWAPDVIALDDGRFIMYYSATTTSDPAKHCIGAAVSDTILGPYKPLESPLLCPLSIGGAIDADGFNDQGQRYVVYKVDGNSIGNGGACGNTVEPIVATPIVLQPVASDGYTLQGAPSTLLQHDGAVDDGILEAPALVKVGNTFVLFFSSGCFTTDRYTVSYATSSDITGPYVRGKTPLLRTGDDNLTAPGGADIYLDGTHMVFHANSGNGRAMYSASIEIRKVQPDSRIPSFLQTVMSQFWLH